MSELQAYLQRATQEGWAVPHFNFSTLEIFNAIINAAQKHQTPVLIGTSEGEAEFMGYKNAVALVRSARERTGLPIFINADHHESFERAKQAVDAGYDSVHIDGSELRDYTKNMELTKQVVEYARQSDPNISVEGELGYLEGSSEMLEEKVTLDPEDLTDPEQADDFIAQTGVNRLAVAVGNVHGVSVAGNPELDIERIKAIRRQVPEEVALVLHGGSGTPEEDIQKAIEEGFDNVHVNTEIRMAYTKALRQKLEKEPDETTPYHYLDAPLEASQKVIEQKIQLFGSAGKA